MVRPFVGLLQGGLISVFRSVFGSTDAEHLAKEHDRSANVI